MLIEKAISEDHLSLTDLTVRSKSFWNYSEHQIKEWLPVLTISEAYIEEKEVYKLVKDDEIIAYYAYVANSPNVVLLDNMFVLPEYIGKGLGKKMMNDFLQRVKPQGCSKVILYSDPNSEGFYHSFGFEVIGQEKTSIVGRFLPIMSKAL